MENTIKPIVQTTEKVSAESLAIGDVIWFSGYWGKIVRIVDGRIYGAWTQFQADRGGSHFFTVIPGRGPTVTRQLNPAGFRYTLTRVFA